jgi:tRNA (pseudouridine54-N1)-methyltransferase
MGSNPSISESLDPFNSLEKNFIVIAHRARSDQHIDLKDLCGASGRWDGIARAITSSLFLSHDMRRDTSIHVILLGPDDPPKVLSILGSEVKYLNPDERACSALMRKVLGIKIGEETGITRRVSPGIFMTRGGLDVVLERISGRKVLLKEDSPFYNEDENRFQRNDDRLYFFLSDDREFSEEEVESLLKDTDSTFSVGPLSLHTYQVITIIHHFLDIGSH